MTTLHRSALVSHSCEQMYQLVDDVKSYPIFIPWVSQSEEISRTETEVVASLTIEYSGISKSFTTRNTLSPFDSIAIRLVEGPFKQLEGVWRFQPKGNHTEISLNLEFEFKSRLVTFAFGRAFEWVAGQLVHCFEKRSRQLYG